VQPVAGQGSGLPALEERLEALCEAGDAVEQQDPNFGGKRRRGAGPGPDREGSGAEMDHTDQARLAVQVDPDGVAQQAHDPGEASGDE